MTARLHYTYVGNAWCMNSGATVHRCTLHWAWLHFHLLDMRNLTVSQLCEPAVIVNYAYSSGESSCEPVPPCAYAPPAWSCSVVAAIFAAHRSPLLACGTLCSSVSGARVALARDHT